MKMRSTLRRRDHWRGRQRFNRGAAPPWRGAAANRALPWRLEAADKHIRVTSREMVRLKRRRNSPPHRAIFLKQVAFITRVVAVFLFPLIHVHRAPFAASVRVPFSSKMPPTQQQPFLDFAQDDARFHTEPFDPKAVTRASWEPKPKKKPKKDGPLLSFNRHPECVALPKSDQAVRRLALTTI